MFRLDVLQNEWLLLALAGGTVLVLLVVLAYLALWRPREREAPAAGDAGEHEPGRAPVPWVLILVYAAVAVYVVVYTFSKVRNPPNW
ncbi:MAG: hypothetical protein IMZ66_07930 [Planctomycetes bacterium]|nr:hypothetical protein [Planctomycetota bacterium]